jgi:hypothetical protein
MSQNLPQNVISEIFDSFIHFPSVTEAENTLQYSQNRITGLYPELFTCKSGTPFHMLL